MPSILLTGGAGYIGSHCVKQLQQQGYSVLVLDNLSTGFQKLVNTPYFIEGDICDKSQLIKIFQEYDITAVMHFAALAYVGESVEAPEKYYFNNVFGSLQLLSAMREAGVKQFIFSSTCAVYGDPQQLPLTETHPLSPINPYGRTKHMVETLLADFSNAYDLRYVSLRYFNAAGADPDGSTGECHHPETHLIPLLLQTALGQRAPITVFGTDYSTPDGTCIRDYLHVNDIAQAHLLALQYLEAKGVSDIFNLGTEKGSSVREVIKACEAVTQRSIAVLEGERRAGDPAALVASAEKIQARLGWKAQYASLESIIETAWSWAQREAVLCHATDL